MPTTMTQPVVVSSSASTAVPQSPVTTPSPQEIIFQAGLGYIVSACVNVAVKLRIPDLIRSGVKSTELLARESGADEESLFRILRVLEMAQIVQRQGTRNYELTAAGELLRRGVPGSLAATLEWIADPLHLTLYSELKNSVETGATTFDTVYGQPFFNWVSKPENAEEAAVFNNAMTSISEMCLPAFLDAYDFSGFERIVDVGGGHGALLRSILKENPATHGTVAEMSCVVSGTRAAIAADNLTDRCEAVECNFFESVPAGGDAYIMKHIVHDWSDRQAMQLLRNIRTVIPADGKLILAEAVIDDSPAPHPGKLLDIEMLAFVGGKERTKSEFAHLLAAAGFSLQRVVPTQCPLSLLEAVPA